MSFLTSLLSLGSKLATGLSLKQWLILGVAVLLAGTHYAAYQYGKSVVQTQWDASSAEASAELAKANAAVLALNAVVNAKVKATQEGYDHAVEQSNKVQVPVKGTCHVTNTSTGTGTGTQTSAVVAVPVAPLRVLFSGLFDAENRAGVSDTAVNVVSGSDADSGGGSGK